MSAKTGSTKAGTAGLVRMLDNKVVKIVLYNGRHVGHGKYMAGTVDDKLVLDENGRPKEFRRIGTLVEQAPTKTKKAA